MIDLLLGMMFKMKEKADTLAGGQKSPSRSESSSHGGSPAHASSPSHKSVSYSDRSLTLDIAQLFLSCLHAWGLDPDLDKLCMNKLGLLQPRCPMSFGLISRTGHMSLMLPGWHKLFCQEESTGKMPKEVMRTPAKVTLMQQARSASSGQFDKSVTLAQRHGLTQSDYTDSDQDSDPGNKRVIPERRPTAVQDEMKAFSSKARWQISSAVTTNHLLSIISTANTLMSMSHATFVTDKIKKKRNR